MATLRFVPLCVIPLLAFASCTGSIGFDISRDIPEQTVPGNAMAHALAQIEPDYAPIQPFTVSVDLSSDAGVNGSQAITRVFLKELSFTITQTAEPAGDTDCWDFVNEVEIKASSTQSGSALPEVTVATGSMPGCVQTFALTPVSDVNLKPYIDEGLRVTATGSGIPPEDDVSFNGHITVRAEPF